MRVMLVGIAAMSAACGSVKERPDAGDGADAAIDGPPSPPPGTIRWARSMSAASPIGVVEGASGVTVTGYFTTIADLGGGLQTSMGGSDTIVGAFAIADAAHLYSYRFGGPGAEFGFLDTVDPQGAPLVAGLASNDYDLGQGPQVSGGGASDGFIGRYGPTGPAWVRRAVGPGEDKLLDTALGPSTVFALGWFDSTTNVEGMALTSAGGRDILFTRWNSFTGDPQVVRRFGGTALDEGSAIAAHPSGDVIATGFFDGTLDFGCGAMTTMGVRDVWVARLTADGGCVWSTRFGGAGEDRDPKVGTDTAGDVFVTGQFAGQAAFGAINLTPVGGVDTFVTRLRGSDGAVQWATAFGSSGTDSPGDIAVDAAGNVFVAASISGPIEDGGAHAGGLDAAILSFAGSTGMLRWKNIYGTTGDDRSGVLGTGADSIYYGLGVAGPVDLGGAQIIGAPNPSGLILKFVP